MRRLPLLTALAALMMVATPRHGAAQWRPADRFALATAAARTDAATTGAALVVAGGERPEPSALPEPPEPVRPAHPALMGAGSAVGAGLGALGGMLGGELLFTATDATGSRGDPTLGVSAAGYFVGAGAGAALGAHLSNRGRGEFGATLLASSLVAATGIAFVRAGGDVAMAAVASIPVASVITAVLVERASTGEGEGEGGEVAPDSAGAGAGTDAR